MSDEQLRGLERTAESDPASRSKLLRAQIRAGVLPVKRVELAAYCGDEGALACLNVKFDHGWAIPEGRITDAWVNGRDFDAWNVGLVRWGTEVRVRASVAAARLAWNHYYRPGTVLFDRDTLNAIEAAEAWLNCPCDQHVAACSRLIPANNGPPIPVFACAPLALILPWHGETPRRGLEVVARLGGEARVWKAIKDTLIAWALRP
jgi:hypothetical protein